jgi:MoaA/NifB/PqqE/SkfB family radical SAM enzyme
VNKNLKIETLKQQYDIISTIDLDQWFIQPVDNREKWLRQSLKEIWQLKFNSNQRLIVTLTAGDEYENESADIGTAMMNLQYWLNKVDISNFFVIVLTNEPNIENIQKGLQKISRDPVSVKIESIGDIRTEKKLISDLKPLRYYQYNGFELANLSMDKLTEREKFLLTESKTFCIYPWIHLHAYPTGEAWPCCHAEMKTGAVGSCKTKTLKEIWNSEKMKSLRTDMLAEKKNLMCGRCYEQEDSGFFSGRQSANKHHGHHISRVDSTQEDGTYEHFQMTYWDIRFSNLCNLRCRSCGHIFSSQWYQDQAKLAGPEWKAQNQVLNYAGRTETDMWEQLLPHIDYVDQIYFAGGEPLMMEEHYRILEELERRGRFDVRLSYNTNFTHIKLKDRSVFDYWKKFKNVAVGASLDAMGPRAEYIRKGTEWEVVEQNRRLMLEICPDVDFYVSSTLSIMNAWHLPDFHKDWVSKGLIRVQDFNVNILQDPLYYRIDIAPMKYKQRLRVKFEEHLEWLRGLDSFKRATVGFESAIKFMMTTDNTHLLEKFWNKTHKLDKIRKENILDCLPELEALT